MKETLERIQQSLAELDRSVLHDRLQPGLSTEAVRVRLKEAGYAVSICDAERPVIGFRVYDADQPIEYASLRAMCETIADCFEQGAFFVDSRGYLELDDDKHLPCSGVRRTRPPREASAARSCARLRPTSQSDTVAWRSGQTTYAG